MEELKHWGILGMKWGIRNYQNPDGTLTPAGRERYGVGEPRKATSVHNISDEELIRMTKRLYTETNYLQARNKYLESQAYYSKLAAKPDKLRGVKSFLNKILGEPITNVLQKDIEFALSVTGATILDESGSKYAKDYMNFVMKRNNKNKNQNNNYRHDNRRDDDEDD